MTSISIQDAQLKLAELIRQLAPGEEVVITDGNEPVARLVPVTATPARRKLGTMQGSVLYMAPDFDAPLDDFEEYGR